MIFLFLIFSIFYINCADEGVVGGIESFQLDLFAEIRPEYTFEFNPDTRIRKYVCNQGYRFTSMRMGSEEIWEGDDPGVKLELLIMNSGEMRAAILHESGRFSTIGKFREGAIWMNTSANKLDMRKLTLHNEYGVRIMSYVTELRSMCYGFIISKAFCYQVRFNNYIMWDYVRNVRNGFPKSVWMDLNNDIIFITFEGKPKFHINLEIGVRFFNLDDELDYTSYRKSRMGQEVSYMMRRSCTMVKYYRDIVWEHTGGPFPNAIIFNRNRDSFSIRFNLDHVECELVDGIWRHERKNYELPI